MSGRGRTLAAFLLPATIGAAPAPISAPVIDVAITPGRISERANAGEIRMEITYPDIDVAPGRPLLTLAVSTPGAGLPQQVTDLSATDDTGAVPLTATGTGVWAAERHVHGVLVARYRLPLANVPPIAGGPPVNLRIDGDGFSSVGAGLVMAAPVVGAYRIRLHWGLAAMGSGAEGVSSYGDGNVELPPGAADRIGRTVFMAGHLRRVSHGAFSAVWAGTPPFDPTAAMDWTAALHRWMSRFWGDESEPPYRVFLRLNPMNAGGGAAFPHSFLVTWGNGVTGDSLRSILGHEMTHTWTANEVGDWYVEGDAVYYESLLAWRAGLISADDYLRDVNTTASRYYTNPMRALPEAEVAPHFWEDTRIRVLPYDRGAMYFAVLDGRIRRASNGRRSVDDLVKEMVRRARAGQPTTQAVWLDLLSGEIGNDGGRITRSMLAGGLMLPESGDFGPCFRRIVRKIRAFDLGFDPRSIVSADKIVAGLRPGSTAAAAGLRNGDHIRYGVAMDAVQADPARTLDLTVTRDGQVFALRYLPRGAAVDAYQWERIPGAVTAGCAR